MIEQLQPHYGASTAAPLGVPTRGFPNPLSLSAVFAGIAVAIAIQLALTLLGAGIGFSTIDPVIRETPTGTTFAVTAGVWWVVSSWIALCSGAWLAGSLTHPERAHHNGVMHGAVVWAVTTIIGLFMLGSAVTALVGGVARTVGSGAIAGAGAVPSAGAAALPGAVTSAIPSLDAAWDGLTRDVTAATQGRGTAPGTADKQLAARAIPNLLDRYLRPASGTASPEDRSRLVAALAAQTGVTQDEAERTVKEWERVYAEARTEFEKAKTAAEARAREVADATAKAASHAAIWAFAASLLGLIAAAVGGALGRRYTVDEWQRDARAVTAPART